ncbi:MAG: outer membrane beta-barrel protein [Nibricoccus sp.]
MKNLRISTCLAVFLCIVSSAHASAAFYLRPSLCYTDVSIVTNEYTSGKVGFSLAAGLALGARQSHALELEAVSTTGMKAHQVSNSNGTITTNNDTRDLSQYLFSFKYTFPPRDSRIRFFIGPTAGYFTEKGKNTQSTAFTYSPVVYPPTSRSISETGALVGPTAGATFSVNTHAKVELSYRHLFMISQYNGHVARQFSASFRYLF